MKYRVMVQLYEEADAPPANVVHANEVYAQMVDAESFDLAALIRQVNTRKRGPRASRKKETA